MALPLEQQCLQARSRTKPHNCLANDLSVALMDLQKHRMKEPQINVFFYGSYINFSVLAEVDIAERPHQVARLPGYRLIISPLANLVEDDSSEVFGILTKLSHRELDRLYKEHAQAKLGGTYLPEAVIVLTGENTTTPALCYLSNSIVSSPPDPAYVERILNPAREYGFPSEYLKHIESFKWQSGKPTFLES